MTRSHRLLLALALAIGCFIGTGCQTWEGFGRDVEDAGEGIQNSDD